MTRPREQAAELARRLEELGHEVSVVPLVEIEPLGDEPVDVDGYDWVVVTSVNGAKELRRRMQGTPKRVAAIGRATADAFGGADLVPAVSTQEGLLAELPRPAGPRALRRRRGCAAAPDRRARRRLRAAVPHARARSAGARLPAIWSCSPPRRQRGRSAAPAPRIPAVSIGPETTAAARTAGVEVVAEAATHDLDGLVAAVAGGGLTSAPCSSRS